MKGKTLRSSRSHIFFKIAVLKILAILSRKYLCWSLFLIKLKTWRLAFLLKKRLQYRCFAVNIVKFLRLDFFFVEHLTVHYTFPKFYVMIKFFGHLRAQNWHFSYFFCHSLDFLSGPWLFRTCFHTEIFSKCNFCMHYNVGSSSILIESLKFRNNSRTAVTSPSNLLWKLWIWVFWVLCFVIISL